MDLKPVVFFLGNYGTGKTEVAVNYALHCRAEGHEVRIADLDLVNPYFRSREAIDVLEAEGIGVIVPDRAWLQADLPILVPQIQGIIEHTRGITILDVGGDDVGATVIGSLHAVMARVDHYDVLQVVNMHRPFSATVAGCGKITREIERAARIRVTAVVSNAHLMDDTDTQTIIDGYNYARDVAQTLEVPLRFITCEKRLLSGLDVRMFDCPVLPISRQLLPPWRRREHPERRDVRLS
jgi:MinD-like ATPase involved in chromosome partitioning or flagellar assembly